jgi:hypothetical protein
VKAAMADPIVLITFYSRCGTTETRALDAAVGAVQARAGIRLRRLASADPAGESRAVPGCRRELERMRKYYVPPAASDLRGADAVIIGLPPECDSNLPEWTEYLKLLEDMGSRGELAGKVGAVLRPSPEFLPGAVAALGFAVFSETHAVAADAGGPDAGDEGMVELGRSVVAAVRETRDPSVPH